MGDRIAKFTNFKTYRDIREKLGGDYSESTVHGPGHDSGGDTDADGAAILETHVQVGHMQDHAEEEACASEAGVLKNGQVHFRCVCVCVCVSVCACVHVCGGGRGERG